MSISLSAVGYEFNSEVDMSAARTIHSDMWKNAKSGIKFEYFDMCDSHDLLRGKCEELCDLFDSFLFIKKNCSRNMDKVLLIKLEAAWGTFNQCNTLSGCAIWLHVIGCPPTVNSLDDLICLVCDSLITTSKI